MVMSNSMIRPTPSTSSLYEYYQYELEQLVQAYKNKDVEGVVIWRMRARISRTILRLVSRH